MRRHFVYINLATLLFLNVIMAPVVMGQEPNENATSLAPGTVIIVEEPTLSPAYYGNPCATNWKQFFNYHGHCFYVTLNTRNFYQSANSGTWQPNLPSSGVYKVEAFVPGYGQFRWPCPPPNNAFVGNPTFDGRYTVNHAWGNTVVTVNQELANNQWLNLGTFIFDAGMSNSVKLDDLNGEVDFTPTIAFSAMRFTYQGPSKVGDDLDPVPTIEEPTSVLINGVSRRKQSCKLSCESRAAVSLAAFYGIHIEEMAFFDALPKSDNPHKGFVGNANDSPGSLPPSGYGVYAEPVAATLKQFGLCVEAHYHFGLENLRSELAAGRPVIVWATYALLHYPAQEYISSDGVTSYVIPYEHTFIAVGYDQRGLYLVDVRSGRLKYYTYEAFNSSWLRFEQMAIAVCTDQTHQGK